MADAPNKPPPQLLTETQTAELLGISKRTLQTWRVRDGSIPFIRIGRCVRYRTEDLNSWIDSNRATSTSAYEVNS